MRRVLQLRLSRRMAVILSAGLAVSLMTACGGPDEVKGGGDRQAEADALRGFYSRMATCLSDQGFPTVLNADGDGVHIDPSSGSESQDDFDAVYVACSESMGGQPPRPAPPSTEEIRGLYHLYVETYECLVAHGHPALEPPSEEVYVETYEASLVGAGSAPWLAYGPEGELRDMQADCPEPSLADLP